MNTVALYIAIVISVILSAFFSGSENALANFNKIRMKNAADSGKKSAALAIRLSEDFSKTISTILFGNNLVNILSSTAATMLFIYYFPANGEAIATVVMTVILLIFGEILPKIIAVEFSDNLAPAVAKPLRFLSILFTPIVSTVSFCVDKLSKLWTKESDEPSVTTDELVTIVENMEKDGGISEEKGELLCSAIAYTEKDVRDVMIPRVDVVAFDIDDGVDALLADSELLQFSRIPVYRDTLDNIIGVLSTKRVILAKIKGEKIDIEKMCREPLFVHMTKTLSSTLEELRKKYLQMAIIIDEYGGTLGILTKEDIIEEIVGEIYDETDDIEEPEFQETATDTFVLDGGMSLEELFDEIGYHPQDFESEYETIGGFATEQLDRFPDAGDHFRFERLDITVLEAQARRVEKVRIKLLSEEEAAALDEAEKAAAECKDAEKEKD